jgi:NAD(P)-dependent dehydrogenase (short-subunit alcohol dehydrogenase family)
MSTYLIVGGSSGIGKALVAELAAEGNSIYATYNNTVPENSSENIHYAQLDVLNEQIDLSYLPDSIDGLVYCPGSITLKPIQRLTISDLENDYKLQVTGFVRILQLVLPKLKKGQNASIVLFSTIAVQKGFAFHSLVSSSKGAVEGLCRALAAELAPSIRVNCIAPSITATPLAGRLLDTDEKMNANAQRHPLKKIGSADDVAGMAAFLLSAKASWITGQVMHIDGGLSSLNS